MRRREMEQKTIPQYNKVYGGTTRLEPYDDFMKDYDKAIEQYEFFPDRKILNRLFGIAMEYAKESNPVQNVGVNKGLQEKIDNLEEKMESMIISTMNDINYDKLYLSKRITRAKLYHTPNIEEYVAERIRGKTYAELVELAYANNEIFNAMTFHRFFKRYLKYKPHSRNP